MKWNPVSCSKPDQTNNEPEFNENTEPAFEEYLGKNERVRDSGKKDTKKPYGDLSAAFIQ